MSSRLVLHAEKRSVTGKQVKALRRQGKLPGVMYGHNINALPIALDLKEATRGLHGLTSSSLVNIELEGEEHATLVREKQRDFIRGTLLHVDFQVVSLTEKIRAKVGIEMTGISTAVKDFSAVVVTGLDEIDVECFPQNLPERFIVDISPLAKIGDGLFVRDIPTPPDVEILNDPDEMIAIATATHEEADEEVAAGTTGVEEPEVIEKGKKEEDMEE